MTEPLDGSPELVINVHGAGAQPADLSAGELAYWISTDELDALLDDIASCSARVGLTFDDGFASDVELALPRLLDRGLTAAFFPCAGLLGQRGRVDDAGVCSILAAGMALGSHGWGHRDWRRLTPIEVPEEFVRSSEVLSDLAGRRVDWAAVPFGSYDRQVLAHLRSAGYRRVYTSDGGLVPQTGWRIPRTSVRPGTGRHWVHRLLSDARQPRQRLHRGLAVGAKGLRGKPRS
jgi:peptidoglycan/xylan/chitin deacetylase (PgdA/CDA1 family)